MLFVTYDWMLKRKDILKVLLFCQSDQKIQMLTTESEMCLFICVFVFIWISVSQKYFVLFHTLYQIHPKTYTQTSQKYQNLYPKKTKVFTPTLVGCFVLKRYIWVLVWSLAEHLLQIHSALLITWGRRYPSSSLQHLCAIAL